MELPREITFTLEGQTVLPQNGGPPDAEARRFGAEWGGTFRLRWPTLHDECRIDALVTGYFQREGLVLDAGGVPNRTWHLIRALMFFDVLAADKPDWVTGDRRANEDLKTAILRAYQLASEAFAEKKSVSVSSGASS
jgi:hypothetical protein